MQPVSYTPTRKSEKRRYAAIFLVACEGSKTEPAYCNKLSMLYGRGIATIKTFHASKNDPLGVLNTAQRAAEKQSLYADDEVWCIVDKDQWDTQHLRTLLAWADQKSTYQRGVALNNPKFELWLLAHFRDFDNTTQTSRQIDRALKTCLEGTYKKTLENVPITRANIRVAMDRCRKAFGEQQPIDTSGTSMHILVEHFIAKATP